MKKKIILIFILSILGTSVQSGTGFTDEPGITDTTIKLGMTAILTGPSAYFGTMGANAAKVYVQKVNDEGGIHGRKLELIVEDSMYQPVQSVHAGKLLATKHNVFAFVCFFASTPLVVNIPLITKEKIPTVASSSPTEKTIEPFNRYIFSTLNPDKYLFATGLEYVLFELKLKNPKVAMFYQDDEFGMGCYNGLKRAAENYKVDIVAAESYKKDEVDFSSQLSNIKKANPDAVFLGTIPSSTGSFLLEAQKVNWKPIYFISSAGSDAKSIEIAGEAIKTAYGLHSTAQEHDDVTGMQELKKISQKYRPDIKSYTAHYIWTWVGMEIAVEGLRRAGRNLTREKFVAAIESIRNYDTKGLSGPITFGPDKRKGNDYVKIYKVDLEKKRFTPVTDWIKLKADLK